MSELLLSYLVFTFLNLPKIWGQIFPKEKDHTHARQWQWKDWTPWAESEFWHDPMTWTAGVNFVAIPLKTAWVLVTHLKAELNFILKPSLKHRKRTEFGAPSTGHFLIGMFSCFKMEKGTWNRSSTNQGLKKRSARKSKFLLTVKSYLCLLLLFCKSSWEFPHQY